MDIVPWPKLHAIRDMVDVMDSTAKEILGQAQKSLEAGDEVLKARIGSGKDILSILCMLLHPLLAVFKRLMFSG